MSQVWLIFFFFKKKKKRQLVKNHVYSFLIQKKLVGKTWLIYWKSIIFFSRWKSIILGCRLLLAHGHNHQSYWHSTSHPTNKRNENNKEIRYHWYKTIKIIYILIARDKNERFSFVSKSMVLDFTNTITRILVP